MLDELNSRLEQLKEYSNNQKIKKMNQRIYNLQLYDEYLSTLTQSDLIYIHVKLHNALSYNKPFADIEDIKKIHDKLVSYMRYHPNIGDKLDI